MRNETLVLIKYILCVSKKSLTAKEIHEKLYLCKYVEHLTTKEIAARLQTAKKVKKDVVFIKTDKNNKYEKKTVYSLN